MNPEKLHSLRNERVESPEKAEKLQAIETLTKMGLFTRVRDIELYHGRAGNGQKWKVKTDFNNGGDATGNNNINKVPALNTSNYETANDFANKRTKVKNIYTHSGATPEVHRIVANDPDAVIIDSSFDTPKDSQQREEYLEALKTLAIGVANGTPAPFKYRTIYNEVTPKQMIQLPDGKYRRYIAEAEVPQIARRLNQDEGAISHLSAGINSYALFKSQPALGAEYFQYGQTSVEVDGEKYLLSQEYAANWLRNAHVVGVKMRVDSVTLDKIIDNVILFDLEKVNTETEIDRKRQNYEKMYGQATKLLYELDSKAEPHSELTKLLRENYYASPREIIDTAKKVPGFKQVFEADTGTWEGYTLEQHTEAVLDMFDKLYADKIPADALPIMRLSLLVHDIGKPVAVAKGQKEQQMIYNKRYAEKFMTDINIDKKTRDLVLGIIGPSQHYTYEGFIKDGGSEKARGELIAFCEELLQHCTGHQVSHDEAFSLARLCLILQTCDSAAYTDMAVIRDGNGMYHPYGSFNDSFAPPTNMTRNNAMLKPKK